MGRFSSVQTYADTSNRVAPESYDKATGGRGGGGAGGGGGGGEEVRAPVVVNVMGSGAGVGSSWYHKYRWEKRREEERLSSMAKEAGEMVAEQALRERMASYATEAEARTAKRAAERRRRKEKERARRGRGKRPRVEGGEDGGEGEGEGGESSSDAEHHDVEGEEEGVADAAGERGEGSPTRRRKVVLQAAGAPLAADESLLVNDGKFMERFLAMTAAAAAAAASAAAPASDAQGPLRPSDGPSTGVATSGVAPGSDDGGAASVGGAVSAATDGR
jgi:hypothetical protein